MNNFLEKICKFWDYIKSVFQKIDEWSDKNFFKFFLFVFIFKSFVFDISMVPSASMTPSAQTGDLVFVNKMTYGVNRNSIQWIGGYLPFFKSKWFAREIKRGETLIFTLPRDPQTIYFKRIIGIEGDSIQMINGILYINDKPVKMKEIGPYEVLSDNGDHVVKGTKYLITLEDGTAYTVFRHKKFGTYHRDNTIKYFIPKGHVWAQGDNHTGSDDCFAIDFMGAEGISVDHIIGKPVLTICGSNSRQKEDPHWMAWFISLPIRVPTYIVNLDFSRFFKKYN